MPHFYFHLYDDMIVMDEEGMELPSLQNAHAWAVRNAREIACAEVMHGKLNLNHRIEVANGGGAVLLTLHFGDVVDVHGRPLEG